MSFRSFLVDSSNSGNVPFPDGNSTAEGTSNETVEDTSKYKNEEARLQSFMAWPIPSGIDGHRLAKAGFYWLQELRKVSFCRLHLFTLNLDTNLFIFVFCFYRFDVLFVVLIIHTGIVLLIRSSNIVVILPIALS